MTAGNASHLVIAPLEGGIGDPVTVHPGEPVVIGRGVDCRVHVDDRDISTQHARVRCHEGSWYVTDLDSRNGTTLNRWALAPNDPVMLHDGDVITVASRRLQVSIAGSPVEPVSAAYGTRASIFVRLRDDRPLEKELAWEEFRARYAPVIIGFSRNAGLPAQDAEDILQDVMMSFFRLSSNFQYDPSKGRFRGYLKQATLNAIRKRAREADPARLVPDDWLEERADSTESHWESEWAGQILTRAIEEAHRRFDEQTMEAFELYARRQVPADDVALGLKMSVNSVHQAKTRVMRVVQAVVDRLRADEG